MLMIVTAAVAGVLVAVAAWGHALHQEAQRRRQSHLRQAMADKLAAAARSKKRSRATQKARGTPEGWRVAARAGLRLR
jgi:hypothetical protein